MKSTKQISQSKLNAVNNLNRRGFVFGLFATGVLATPNLSIAQSGVGFRRLRMVNDKTEEMLDVVYWADGKYFMEVLDAINYFMRDIRKDAVCPMVRANLNNLVAIQNVLNTSEPFNLISGYRTKETNVELSRRSQNVAKNSLHIRGMAADVQLKSRSNAQIASAAYKCGVGGIGKYSEFVHIDCGRRRTW